MRAIFFVMLVFGCSAVQADSPKFKTRKFEFTYTSAVSGQQPGASVSVWIPAPLVNDQQQVDLVRRDLPTEPKISNVTGNRILYFQAPADAQGSVDFSMTYRVTRQEIGQISAANSDQPDDYYLKPDKLVPVGGRVLSLLKDRVLPKNPAELARLLYNCVDDHLQYRKDRPGWGRGDSLWACDSQFGNCTDFHSLFISLARSENLPTKFEIGFAIPETRGAGRIADYHCWAYFKPSNKSWMPVDISEANLNPARRDYYFGHLDENRVGFTIGRDLELIPRQQGPALNFFVYPYAEVDGALVPVEQIHSTFSYCDDMAADLQSARP